MTLFDPGLQPERTALAWRRTALSLGLGSLVAVRMLPATLGAPAWAFVGLTGLLVSAAVWAAARRRSTRTIHVLLRDGDRAVLPDGLLVALLASVATGAGLGGVILVVVHHVGPG